MSNDRWVVGQLSFTDRMPPLPADSMDEKQRKAAEELTRGPRGGVKGPFVAALRSPELVDRLGRLGEYLRFGSSLQPRIGEFVMLIVSREWTNQFEWRCTRLWRSRTASSRECSTPWPRGAAPRAWRRTRRPPTRSATS